MSNITTIYKPKGSRRDLESDRGIFGLSVFKKIIDSLIYKEKYPLIDARMSDSNIGARKMKNIRNHLFIIYGVINSVLKGESECIDIQIYDLVKAFDVLWLADTMNDLWDTLPEHARDDKLGLVYQTSKTNMVAVNTAVGQSERTNIPEITTQGGTWGPMLCSNSIDQVGKYSLENGHFYNYKNMANIIPLAMVDDLLAVSSCGFASTAINTTINTIIELKKLQFHIPEAQKKSKCHFLHIGKPNKHCPGMKVHGHQAYQVEEAVYLGDIVRADGKNSSNIKSRVNKGMGIITEIMDILNCVSFGHKYFEIATTLREARLLNGILTNADVWYSIQKSEIDELEDVDKMLLRRILAAPDSTCIESLYLELGLIPIHVLLKARRVIYLHYLATQNENEMLYKTFIAQWKYPVKDDWTEEAKSNLSELKINLSLEEIKKKSADSFKRMVKIKAKEYALEYLLKLKGKHSKMNNLSYSELKLQKYLKDPDIPVNEAKNLYRFRTRSAKYKQNMKTGYSSTSIACPLCQVQPDTQPHSLQCTEVKAKTKVEGRYLDIFEEDIPSDISKTLLRISKIREDYI